MQNLTIQAEVGSVMESMLGDLEAWEWANKEEVLKKELENARAQVQALKDSEGALLEVMWMGSCGNTWVGGGVAETDPSAYTQRVGNQNIPTRRRS